ncbi:LacI family DNA-binding transcriptional regulator [Bifidobacterium biavatii]|uniref:Laci-type response repressor n=1 Tax=Bifidobacterium biavatii DSM 23969 TaxID=1437608 RepID=A0A086ZVX1_9BIFI|nr:LacI family DNA-binding transcriptional regulator [Bifidobacterium biavatii]KFI50671.1 laci-type response repressor [Bifidobacterium biavatii DSM 23969]
MQSSQNDADAVSPAQAEPIDDLPTSDRPSAAMPAQSQPTHEQPADTAPADPNHVVTLADVARATGFSQMTVSNALRDRPKVSEANRRKIKEIAQRMGYQANAAATMLRNRRSGIIQIVIDDFEVPFHASLAKYLAQEATARGYQVAVRQSERSGSAEMRVLKTERGLIYDGVILDAPNITEAQVLAHAHGRPAFVIGDCADFSAVDSMDTACAPGAAAAAEHLWERGCREFYVLGAPEHWPADAATTNATNTTNHMDFGPRRFAAIVDALARHGACIDDDHRIPCDWTLEGGHDAATRLATRLRATHTINAADGMATADDSNSIRHSNTGSESAAVWATDVPVGVLCLTDTVALGALRAFAEHGVRVPDDVRVIGFDGLAIDAYAVPSLSTVAMDVPAMAATVVARLVAAIETQPASAPPAGAMHETIPYRLVARESSR